jgi:hypothetical protein
MFMRNLLLYLILVTVPAMLAEDCMLNTMPAMLRGWQRTVQIQPGSNVTINGALPGAGMTAARGRLQTSQQSLRVASPDQAKQPHLWSGSG